MGTRLWDMADALGGTRAISTETAKTIKNLSWDIASSKPDKVSKAYKEL
jgi:hypothetical protein